MLTEKDKKIDWLYIASLLWAGVGFMSFCPAGSVVAFFDSPSPNGNANNLFIYSLISFPITCLAASVGIRLLKNRAKKLAFYLALPPVLPLILIFVGSNWMSNSFPR